KYNIRNADVILYQKLIRMSDEDIAAMDYEVIALDEYHHDTSKVWGNKVRTLIDTHSESIIFGTSATPVRTDGVNTIDELFEGNCASNLSLSESIAKKIVPLPKYIGALYKLDDELEKLRKKVENATNTKEEKDEFYKKINVMRSQIEKSYGMPIILNKHIRDKEGKYLVFCKNKTHLREIKDTVIGWFKTAGCKNINAYEVYSNYEYKDAEYNAFCEDTSHSLKLLFCIDLLNEGLHLENISGALLLRPTRSSIVWHQQIGRAIEANNTNTPVIVDAVNNFSSVRQGMELLREIKNDIAKEKESDPNFDDSAFENIDTFFVLEQIMEVKEMFKEMEGRLEGSWDLYVKALRQYKEREGDCDVPKKHVEVLDSGVSVKLGQWVSDMRKAKKGTIYRILTEERISQLNQLNFIWEPYKKRFEKNIRAIAEYYEKFEKYPYGKSKDLEIKKLGEFLSDEKMKMRNDNITYPEWKKEILEKYLPDFSYETRKDRLFNEFIYYVKLYKKKYNHVDIRTNDTINGYNIGTKRNTLSRCKTLSEYQIKELKNLGVYLGKYNDKRFNDKMELAKQAVKEGIIINFKSTHYCGNDLFSWIKRTVKKKFLNNQLMDEEIKVLEKLMNRSLEDFYSHGLVAVKVVDLVEGKEVGVFDSQAEVCRVIQETFDIKTNVTSIRNRLTGKITKPYKGRFMFYHVDDLG
ncbi:MAG: Helicase associated domain protein, partial [Lachnospiraceae bacterium]